jgi:hypothetical protein
MIDVSLAEGTGMGRSVPVGVTRLDHLPVVSYRPRIDPA